jgi:NAD(P)-dependent dehydrogenase (short-subunit alcohol dehydrogenase family)
MKRLQLSLLGLLAMTFITGTTPSIVYGQNTAPTVLITGSSKGHGFAFVKDYAARGWDVIATCRTPSSADRHRHFGHLRFHSPLDAWTNPERVRAGQCGVGER